MIGKATPTGTGFKGLVSYLMRGKTDAPNPDRVAWLETRNLLVDDPEMVPRIMRNTASRSVRCEKPVYHFVVSWHKDENPTSDLMRQVGDTTITDLKLAEHQAILIAHRDTDHHHLHVVVNRVHPESHRAWSKSHDWRAIEVSIGRQSKELGLRYVPGRHNEPHRFREVAKHPRNSELQRAERLGSKEQLRPRWTAEQIASRRPRLAQTVERARNWEELDRALAVDGFDVMAKGQGLVIGDAGGTMKLSQLKRDVRLKGLEQRFGESFEDFDRRREDARRLAEMTRAQRIAEREQQLAERRLTKANVTSEDASAQDEPPETNTAPAASPKEQTVQHANKDELHETLAKSKAEADLAYTLHKTGLVTQAQLRHAVEARQRAQEEVDKHKTLKERFQRELIEALTPKEREPEPKQNPKSQQPQQSKTAKQPEATKAKRRQKDRDRER